MEWPIDRDTLVAGNGAPRYELIAAAVEEAIASGQLRVGERLPPVRQFSKELGVSGATIAAAYDLLNQRGRIEGQVGRGTFVAAPSSASPDGARDALAGRPGRPGRPAGGQQSAASIPWRRRIMSASAVRLRAAYPAAADCTSGWPDPMLLPLDALRRAWRTALDETTPAALQYASPEPVDHLVQELMPRLTADGVPARATDVVVGSSAQQLMLLIMRVASRMRVAPRAAGTPGPAIAIEEPGYSLAFDTLERAGYRLVGVDVDEHGAMPASVDAALASGAAAILLTPRAHNPTGASWSASRRDELADVLAAHPDVVAIEDDHFAGVAAARPGSLLADPRIEDRVVYLWSFSKAIAPDLRVAVAVARPRLRSPLIEAKSFADGWTSRLAQRAVAHALADDELDRALETARAAYAARRAAAAQAIMDHLAPAGYAASGADGVNIWVHLPLGADATDVIERAAALGVLVAPGESFFLRPGHIDAVRLSVGMINTRGASEAGRALATAAAAATTIHTATVASSI